MSDTDPVRTVLDRLHGAKAAGDGWAARCPAHDDRKASLSIHRGDDGRVLLKCFRGCETDAIARALNLEVRDLFVPSNGNGHGRPSKLGPVVATYDYQDEAGALLYQVARYAEPAKDFRQRRPDGAGGWVWSLKGARRVLFGLPNLTDHTDVLLVEGEKDVLTLQALGLTATTSCGGAQGWGRGAYAEQLAKAGCLRLTILPDNDPPGRQYAQDAARSCSAAGIVVKVLPLPGLPPGGDVSDFLAAGHTKAELLQLVAQASPWTPCEAEAPGGDDSPWWQTGPAFEAEAEKPAPPMLVHGLIPGEGITLLHADPRTLKTWIAEDIAIGLSSGTPALTTLTTGGPSTVLYLSNEDGRRLTADRLRRLARGRGLPGIPDRLLLAVQSGAWLDDEAWQAKVITLARRDRVRVVILDPIRSLTGACDKGPSELQPFTRFLRLLMQAADCALILVHHDTKPLPGQPDTRKRAYRASGGGLFSIADSPIHAERVGDEPVVLLYPNSWKFAETPGPLEVRLTVTEDTAALVAKSTDSASATDRAAQIKILNYLAENPDRSGSDVSKAIRGRKCDVLAELDRMATTGVVDSRPGPKRSVLWFPVGRPT